MKMFIVRGGVVAAALVAALTFSAPASADGWASVDVGSGSGAFSNNNSTQNGDGSAWSTTGSNAGGWTSGGAGQSYGTSTARGNNANGAAGSSTEHKVAGSAAGQISGPLGLGTTMQSFLGVELETTAASDDGSTGPGTGSARGQTGGHGSVGFQYSGAFGSFQSVSSVDSHGEAEVSGQNAQTFAGNKGVAWSSSDLGLVGGVNTAAGSQNESVAETIGRGTASGSGWNSAEHETSGSTPFGSGSVSSQTGTMSNAAAESSGGGRAHGTASASSFASNGN